MAEATQAPPAVGTFCWNELLTGDVDNAKTFYMSLFGWTSEEKDMGPAGKYTCFTQGDKQIAGCMKTPQEGMPVTWMAYIAVDDVDATTKKAEGLGAKISVPPADIPEIGRFSVITDPTGGTIGLFQGKC